MEQDKIVHAGLIKTTYDNIMAEIKKESARQKSGFISISLLPHAAALNDKTAPIVLKLENNITAIAMMEEVVAHIACSAKELGWNISTIRDVDFYVMILTMPDPSIPVLKMMHPKRLIGKGVSFTVNDAICQYMRHRELPHCDFQTLHDALIQVVSLKCTKVHKTRDKRWWRAAESLCRNMKMFVSEEGANTAAVSFNDLCRFNIKS